ncbi:hypothetical protein BGZ54_004000, partial [Gamsiella multidivaricata]
EVEEIIEKEKVEEILKREEVIVKDETTVVTDTKTIVTDTKVAVEETTTTETTVADAGEHSVKQIIVVKESGETKPTVSKGVSWLRRALSAGEAAARSVGHVAVGAGVVAGLVTYGALQKVDGVWKRTVQVLTTRKARVDELCPIAKHSFVYYDEDVYDSVLIEKKTGVKHVTQLLYDSDKEAYFVYYRWSETDYKLDGPHETIEEAKSAYLITYKEKFDVEWTERETAVSERWTIETKTYVEFEEVHEVEEIVEETKVEEIIKTEKATAIVKAEAEIATTTKTETTVIEDEEVIVKEETQVVIEKDQVKVGAIDDRAEIQVVEKKSEIQVVHEKEKEVEIEVIEEAIEEKKTTVVETKEVEIQIVQEEEEEEKLEVVEHKRDVSVTEEKTTVVTDVEKVVELELVKEQVVTPQPAVSKSTSWFRRFASGAGEAAAGALTQVDGVWKRTVQVLTTRKAKVDELCPIAKHSLVYYDEEVYDSVLISKESGVTHINQLLYDTKAKAYYIYIRWSETDFKLDGPHKTIDDAKSAFQVTYKSWYGIEWTEREKAHSDKWTVETKTYETIEETEEVEEIVQKEKVEEILEREEVIVEGETTVVTDTKTIVTDTKVAVEEKTTKDVVLVDTEEHKVKQTIVIEKSGETKPTVSKGTSWLRRLASGAGEAAAGALTQVDGVWKRTVQVLTTRKADVDERCPIAKHSFVYYDEDVYDSVLVEKSTGVKHVTQLLYDSDKEAYFVYYRWSETDYKLDGPHETVEQAKSAFQITYKEKFDVEWTERETTVSEKWTYETKTYETIEETEEVEEIVEETEVKEILKREEVVIVDDKIVKADTKTTVTETEAVVTVEETTTTETQVVDTEEHKIKETIVVEKSGETKPTVSK